MSEENKIQIGFKALDEVPQDVKDEVSNFYQGRVSYEKYGQPCHKDVKTYKLETRTVGDEQVKKYWLETETPGGELISLALVSELGQEFYQVLDCANPEPWVAEHVIPVLEKDSVTRSELQTLLQNFLFQFDDITIIADWPDDIKYFCEALITGPGVALNHPPIRFVLDRTLSSEDSKVPHNALHDARAIADQHMTEQFK